MATELDFKIDAIIDQLTQPGQPFETGTAEHHGGPVKTFVNAPPTLAHYFAHYCQENAETLFLVDGDQRLTFGDCWAAATRVAAGLVEHQGMKKGDRVGIAARNSSNWIICYMGIILGGGCATLLNGFWSGEELAAGIRIADCAMVLCDDARAERLQGTDHGSNIVLIEHDRPAAEGLSKIWADGDTAMAMLGELGPDDLATVLYTSGSTGQAKGAYSTHHSVVHGIMNYMIQSAMAKIMLESEGADVSSQPSALIAVPLFHVTGEVPLFLQSFGIVRKLVLMPKWDARDAMRLMEAEAVTYFVGVPLMSYEIATHPDLKTYDLSACKSFAAGGAPRPVEHVNKIRDAFPDSFPLLGYGLTETNAVGCGNFNENYLAKPGSTGKPNAPLVDLAILDDDGNPLEQGKVGEISIRTIANFSGYWQNDEATDAAFTGNGYFRTGDLGYLDEDGYVYIVDRKKDIIIRGGENISCIEVEEAIYAHDAIAECSVFALPDARFGEVPGAVYHVKDGADLTAEQLRDFLCEHIAAFKVPVIDHIWQSHEDLPRLGTQKIDKRTVRKMFANELVTN